ncbi:hypothetical protein KCG43_21235 [Photobacterium sp. WH24]|uniref:hypothetical protein n=1 Tax=Photobacterium TaxID=657 RepID=UPI0013734F53|nr:MULTISPECIES: hypothetical protein [Photobacterium]MBV7264534.1 hypothetical protein [Photobacterium sp. WH24]NAX45764.1 hypothetical protein [Photobacterium halotolerans]
MMSILMINDNPASRLLVILQEGKKVKIDANTTVTWKQLLRVPPHGLHSDSKLMAKLGQFMLLPHEVQKLIGQFYPEQSQDLKYCISRIQTALTEQNLKGNWHSFISHIDDHTISTLSMSSVLLDHKLETKLIKSDELDSLKEKISNVLSETIKAELPEEFKKFITHYLKKILSSIDDYFISGAVPILDALEATLGHAVLDPSFKETLTKTPIGGKIRTVLGDVANIVTVAAAASGAVTYLSTSGFPLLAS